MALMVAFLLLDFIYQKQLGVTKLLPTCCGCGHMLTKERVLRAHQDVI